jgi:cytochrome d ubiquinol oxidase subunit I
VLAAALPQVSQQYLFEARQMQALSLGVHIPLVCFGISFPTLVLFAEWRYRRTGDRVYLTLARRWSKVMITLFAVGVVTGTILSFEFGLLWPNFMATYGSVFGLGFGLEGFSFFLEAIFIGIYVYGWDRLSPRNHLLSGIPIIIAGITGSLFVIAVNAWMNHPTGFKVEGGQVVDVHPWQALFGNAYFLHEFVHMYLAGYIVTGFLVAGVYAYAFLRGRAGRYHRTALAVALAGATLASLIQPIVGDWAARDVADHQPVKLAAIEGLAHTTRGAPEHLLGWYESNGEISYGIRIPRLLSLLARHDPNATIQGLDSVPPRDRPPVNVVRFSFQAMVGIGLFLAALSALYLAVVVRRGRPPEWRWFHGAVVAAGPLALAALIAGWITTEVGRQPWIVDGLMRTSAAVTGAKGIPVAYGTLVAVYVCLAVAVVWVLRRIGREPLDAAAGAEPPPALRPSGAIGAR